MQSIKRRDFITTVAAGGAALAGAGLFGQAFADEAHTYADGVFESEVNGVGGTFVVSVTIAEGIIANVSVGDNSETPELGGKAIEELPAKIVAAGGIDGVDVISGATITSQAIFQGVSNCLALASGTTPTESAKDDMKPIVYSGKHAWEVQPDPITDIAQTLEYEVVIIGGSTSGNAAAEAASREGAAVAVLEQNMTFGRIGMDCASIGTQFKRNEGVDLDPEEVTRVLWEQSRSTANRELIHRWATRSGEVFDYLIDLAERNGLVVTDGKSATYKVDWGDLDEKWRVYNTPVSFINPEDGMYGRTKDGESANYNLMKLLVDQATANGADYYYNTRAVRLVTDESGAVTGVVARAEDGSHIQFNATRGVIIATGCFSGNQEMIDAWCPIVNRADSVFYPFPNGNLGDGYLMALWAGAALSRTQPAYLIHPVDEEFVLSSFYMAWLTVNAKGMRYNNEMPIDPYVTNGRMTQPGNVAWNIFDSDYEVYLQRQWPTKYEHFVNVGSTYIEGPLADRIAERLENGSLIQADTIEELAEAIGVPADTLVATVDRYNSLCADGVDVDFGVPQRWQTPVQKPPFYAYKVPALACVIPYGLHVDENSQVLNDSDEPIGGLFAIGNMQGDFFAFNYPVCCPGLSCGRGVTFGQLVGAALAHGTVIGED